MGTRGGRSRWHSRNAYVGAGHDFEVVTCNYGTGLFPSSFVTFGRFGHMLVRFEQRRQLNVWIPLLFIFCSLTQYMKIFSEENDSFDQG